jgi:tRNA1Val (adenine37-N6)-methyltransferase
MTQNLPFIDHDERLDTIAGTTFSLIQKIDGTAFSIDTLLLANFIHFGSGKSAADLGAGSGILSFLMKFCNPSLSVTGFELQRELYELSLRNIKLNPDFTNMAFENQDVRDIPARFFPETFDIVASNPPYFPAGSGRIPEKLSRAKARHELNGTLGDFIETGAYLLPYGGSLYLVLPKGRFNEALKHFKNLNLGLKRLRQILPKEGEEPHLVLLEAEKFYNGEITEQPSFAIHLANGDYSDEIKRLLEDVKNRL